MNISEFERNYLDYKTKYYSGLPSISDAEFDYIEQILKDNNSPVINMVGAKLKDFDFPHPTPMKSLDKIQTEMGNNKYSDVLNWYYKYIPANNSNKNSLLASPKLDGNAINLIYKNGQLTHALTRGDGLYGKNVTNKVFNRVPNSIIDDSSVIEVRCEAVIKLSSFNKYFSDQFANARNFIAGYLGSDEKDEYIEQLIDLIPIRCLKNGEDINLQDFIKNSVQDYNHYWHDNNDFFIKFNINNYNSIYEYFVNLRKTYDYQLDGIVLSFDYNDRYLANETDHHPLWSKAIKFIPDEAVSTYKDIQWNIGKSGEMCPVVIMEPVKLAGTIVKKASAYNAGYIVNNKIGPGSIFTLAKAGDIIPEIQSITVKSYSDIILPTHCPNCNSILSFDGLHLMCNNEDCGGRAHKKLQYGLQILDIKRVGPSLIEPFSKDFSNMSELFMWVKQHIYNNSYDEFKNYGFDITSKTFENFIDGFKNINNIDSYKIIQCFGINGVGEIISKGIAKYMDLGVEDFKGFDKSIIEYIKTEEFTDLYYNYLVKFNNTTGCLINRTASNNNESNNLVYIEMTGSPKNFGFKTKDEYIKFFNNKVVSTSLTDSKCNYLVTDDLNSSSSKMKSAKSKGIKIVTYNELTQIIK